MNQNEDLLASIHFWGRTKLYMSSAKVTNFALPKSVTVVPESKIWRD